MLTQELETWSLGKSVFLRRERDIWDQLQRQKGLLAGANELLAAQSTEVEDLRLCCADAKVEAAMAQDQVAPLAARVKELEKELTRVAGERDVFRSRAREAMASGKVLVGQLGAEQSAHQLMKGALNEALTVVEASRTEAVVWRGKAEELGREASRASEAARVEAQRLKEKVEAPRVEAQRWKEKAEASQVEAQHWGQKAEVGERLRGALHTGVNRALAVIASHYIGVDLQAISDGYVLPDDDEEADEAVAKLMEAAVGPGSALAKLFEEEVVPPPPSANAGGPEP
ncbi:uncharacterized protein [Miscanthus floridulus]|uniref:uncharacterized protein n=1 Tax=Miscanthus floridulus TaxID=154761 RepID=UPI003459886E